MTTFRFPVFAIALGIVALGALQCAAADGPDPSIPELKVLDRWVGEWRSEMKSPDGQTIVGERESKWILKGRFLQSTWETTTGQSGMIVRTFDRNLGKYRAWWFNDDGIGHEQTGAWDAKTNTMTTTSKDLPGGMTVTTTAVITEDGREDWTFVVKDASGSQVFELKGTSERRKK